MAERRVSSVDSRVPADAERAGKGQQTWKHKGIGNALRGYLKRRGLEVFRCDPDYGLLPATLAGEKRNRFYDLMKRYSFRLFLREVIKRQDGFGKEEVVKYSSLRTVNEYMNFLSLCSLLTKVGNNDYALTIRPVFSFGITLEWFVAEIFKREFDCEALYEVRFREAPAGGDYDVIALWENKVIYMETKSSPPKGIEKKEIKAFFNRVDDLMPHLAIFLNDTELRMKDKIVPLFEEELERRFGAEAKVKFPVSRMMRELFHINHTVFIINSKKTLRFNILACIQDSLSLEKRLSGPW